MSWRRAIGILRRVQTVTLVSDRTILWHIYKYPLQLVSVQGNADYPFFVPSLVVPTRHNHKVNKVDRQPKTPQTAVPVGMRSASFNGRHQMASSNLSFAEQQATGAYWGPTPPEVSGGGLGMKPDLVTSSTTEEHRDVSGRRGSLPGHNQLEVSSMS